MIVTNSRVMMKKMGIYVINFGYQIFLVIFIVIIIPFFVFYINIRTGIKMYLFLRNKL